MISAWKSATGWDSSKCSEKSGLEAPLREGWGVFESDGAIAKGRPRRMEVPRSWTWTMAQRRMRS